MASVDDVHSLLNAVNTVTLKRMQQALRIELHNISSNPQKVMRKLDIPVEPSAPA